MSAMTHGWVPDDTLASRLVLVRRQCGLSQRAAAELAAAGERRVVVSVHCYGRRTWFYRWAAGRLGERLFWLSPAMKQHYEIDARGGDWTQCVPGCVPGTVRSVASTRPSAAAAAIMARWFM